MAFGIAALTSLPGGWVAAQTIVPDGSTETIIQGNGNLINISGETLSGDGGNLFHSFEQFDLRRNQVANFISRPDIRNIIGSISSGDASVINGIIQVTGGNSNLFLINPAGFFFGPNASLNVPGDFSAATATAIGFGADPEGFPLEDLDVFGENDWASLIGNPRALLFEPEPEGIIFNQGNLAVGEGNNITLLANIIINNGTVEAPGGNIVVAEVPGESLLRLSAEGQILALDVPASTEEIDPLELAELLTGGEEENATEVRINEDGEVELVGSGLTAEEIANGEIDNIDDFEGIEEFYDIEELREAIAEGELFDEDGEISIPIELEDTRDVDDDDFEGYFDDDDFEDIRDAIAEKLFEEDGEILSIEFDEETIEGSINWAIASPRAILNLDMRDVETVQNSMKSVRAQTEINPTIIHAFIGENQLYLVMRTVEGENIHESVNIKRRELLRVAQSFRQGVNSRSSYLPEAQQLYRWLIAPLEAELKSRQIDTLLLSMDAGLRTIPLAALHDGEQFLAEKYSFSLIPSINLVDLRFVGLQEARVLAMGVSEFNPPLNPLPVVPFETDAIVQHFWPGQALVNQDFTRDNLKNLRKQQGFEIIHIATHANFQAGNQKNSYIQMWDGRLRLDEMRELEWHSPPTVELLVLSACRTGFGDDASEMGFAGLSVQAGVKSTLASLWQVSDLGTLGLMSEFYQQLQTAPIKAEALGQTQRSMIRGEVKIEGGTLVGSFGTISLPPELTAIGNADLSHPYYWAAFTMVGSPW
ncbi:MAG: CHAT domain-containing protein [Oscillatoria sp. SIO1A7]|nr:CHAT domain-containing protein [Oscillatoria sp. SIO1A7]